MGGLTVLKEIVSALGGENVIYLGDTARVPYGIRSAETVMRYSFENTSFLIKKGIKLLVIACNTASSVSLEKIKESFSIPVLGVIEPGSRAAAASTRNKKVGVIGTEATVKSSAYLKAIKTIDKDVEVTALACPLFVPLAEEGWVDGEIARLTAEKYLADIRKSGIDTLVLGCTHYPLLKGVISDVVGKEVALIDSALEMAKEVKRELEALSMLNLSGKEPRREFYVTDSPERFLRLGERFLGRKIDDIHKVELNDTEVSE